MKSSNNFPMELIEIGRVVRSHGLTGRVKVLSYLESPETLHDVSGLFVGRSAQEAVFLPLVAVQTGKGFFILQLRGVDDRDAAERLRGSSVWISSEKTVKLPDGEYYWSEIIGLQVLTEEDQILGRIEAVFPTGRGATMSMSAGEGGGKSCCPPSKRWSERSIRIAVSWWSGC
ncbi:MAG: ribosome maturation factor RimM [Deltaproteobacteria bacterium]|nr:ribosome maturation factor RimM [Deltaproteobacteria bacterium]